VDFETAKQIGFDFEKVATAIIDKPPMAMEFEKISSCLLYGPKRRAERIYIDFDPKVFEEKSKGLQEVRRDSCKYLKDTMKVLHHEIFDGNADQENLIRILDERLSGLRRAPLQEMAFSMKPSSKTMEREGDMKVISAKIAARKDTPLMIGERFLMVYTDRGDARTVDKRDLADTLEHAADAHLKHDVLAYLEHMKGAIVGLLEPLSMTHAGEMLFNKYTMLAQNSQTQLLSVTDIKGTAQKPVAEKTKRKRKDVSDPKQTKLFQSGANKTSPKRPVKQQKPQPKAGAAAGNKAQPGIASFFGKK
jgi:hypothetical protein